MKKLYIIVCLFFFASGFSQDANDVNRYVFLGGDVAILGQFFEELNFVERDPAISITPSTGVVSPDKSKLYFISEYESEVSYIDQSSNTIKQVSGFRVGSEQPLALGFNANGSTLYVSFGEDGSLYSVDTQTNIATFLFYLPNSNFITHLEVVDDDLIFAYSNLTTTSVLSKIPNISSGFAISANGTLKLNQLQKLEFEAVTREIKFIPNRQVVYILNSAGSVHEANFIANSIKLIDGISDIQSGEITHVPEAKKTFIGGHVIDKKGIAENIIGDFQELSSPFGITTKAFDNKLYFLSTLTINDLDSDIVTAILGSIDVITHEVTFLTTVSLDTEPSVSKNALLGKSFVDQVRTQTKSTKALTTSSYSYYSALNARDYFSPPFIETEEPAIFFTAPQSNTVFRFTINEPSSSSSSSSSSETNSESTSDDVIVSDVIVDDDTLSNVLIENDISEIVEVDNDLLILQGDIVDERFTSPIIFLFTFQQKGTLYEAFRKYRKLYPLKGALN